MDNQLSNMRLHEQIAQRIIADFLADGMATRLPSIDELARWYHNNFFAGFIGALRTELMKQGVRLSVVLRERPQQGERFIRWDLDAARSYIEKPGNRYRGALIIEVLPELDVFATRVRELSSSRGKQEDASDHDGPSRVRVQDDCAGAPNWTSLLAGKISLLSMVLEGPDDPEAG